MSVRRILPIATLIFVSCLISFNPPITLAAIGSTSSATFSCGDSRTAVEASGASSVTSGSLTLFAGYRQVSATNQNPIIAAFDGTTQQWCREDYDTSPADSRAYGLVNVGGTIYATFTADGGNVTLTAFTGSGWINSYGSGGGPRVAVVLRLNPSNGDPTGGTFIINKLNSGNTNTASVTSISASGGNISIGGSGAFGPLDPNENRRNDCSSNDFTYVLSADLSTIVSATCPGGGTLLAGGGTTTGGTTTGGTTTGGTTTGGTTAGGTTTAGTTTGGTTTTTGGGTTGGGSSSDDDDDDDDGDDDDGGGGGVPAPFFNDGRLNNNDIDAPAAVYCESGDFAFYSVIGFGNARVTAAQLIAAAQQAVESGTEVVVLNEAGIRLIVSPARILTMFAVRSSGTETYQFTFSIDACGALNLQAIAPATTTSVATGTYTVQRGDTLFRIAVNNGVTVSELAAANNLSDPNVIFPGQTLVIP